MVQRLGAPTPGSRPGIKRLELRPSRRTPPPTGATLRETNAIGMQSFFGNPDGQAGSGRLGDVASPVATDRRTPTGQYIVPSVRGLVHQRAVQRGQVAQVAKAKALSMGRQGPNGPTPTATDLLVADRVAEQAVRASDEQYGMTIANTLPEVRRAVDDVEASYPSQPESLLASLPPNRVESLRLFADLARHGSPAQFSDRVDEVIRAAD